MEDELYKKLAGRYSECKTSAYCTELVEELTTLLSREEEQSSKKEILSLIQSVIRLKADLTRQEIFRDAETTIRRLIDVDRDDPHAHVLLSEFYLLDQQDFEAALHSAEEAVSLSEKNGNYFRLALGQLARVAVKLSRFDIVAEVMRRSLDHQPRQGEIDTGIESDFATSVPADAIPSALMTEYLNRAKKSK